LRQHAENRSTSAIARIDTRRKRALLLTCRILLLTLAPHELDKAWKWAGAAALALAFVAYTADYSTHRSIPHHRAAKADAKLSAAANPPNLDSADDRHRSHEVRVKFRLHRRVSTGVR
jgi:hypothetical protein